jgi:ABC-type transport system substrate-binding protein
MRLIQRKTELPLVSRAAVALLLAGCNGPLSPPIPTAHADDETPRRGGVLQLASFGDIRGLDPAVAFDALSTSAMEAIYAGLVDFDAHANVVPDIADRYEVTDDGLTYRFFLREGVRFHDGVELVADDVKRSVERALHSSTPSSVASFYESIAGYKEYTQNKTEHLAGVEVEGRYVVAIRLNRRDARFLAMLALHALRPVCRSAGDRYVDNWAPCGAGPFKIGPGGWDRGRSLTLVRHEGYFRPGRPYLDGVVWTYSMSITAEGFRFEDGELDSTRDMHQADLIRFLVDPRWKAFGEYEPDRTIMGEVMNTELPPFDNVEVRRAVASAIDREHYRLINPLHLFVVTEAIPPAVPGYNPDFRGQQYDYQAALEHMKKAGYPYDPVSGKGGYPHPIAYYTYRQGTGEKTAQVLQQELAKIGLKLDIRMVNYPTFLALSQRRKSAQMTAPSYSMDYPDPSDFFEPLFSTGAINNETSNNYAFYSNPRLDELLDRAREELEQSKRFALYDEANRIVCDDAPWAFTSVFRFYAQWQPYVHGLRTHAVWSQYVLDTWLDRRSSSVASRAREAERLGSWASVLGTGPR